MEGGLLSIPEDNHHRMKHLQPTSTQQLYQDIPQAAMTSQSYMQPANPFSTALTSLTSRLGIALPNPAPEVEMTPTPQQDDVHHHVDAVPAIAPEAAANIPHPHEPKKKKYAKEAWPGKKPMPTLLV